MLKKIYYRVIGLVMANIRGEPLFETEKFGQILIPRCELYKISYLFVKIEARMNEKLMLTQCVEKHKNGEENLVCFK